MAGINIRQKGANGEREVATAMNSIVMLVMTQLGFPAEKILEAANSIQRNQNQSAVGGSDLSNTFGMGIEVKRQETLSINTWWKQCTESAKRNSEWPVLIYRQNHGKWQVMTYLRAPVDSDSVTVRATMDWDAFLYWFKAWVENKLRQGHAVKL